MDLLIIAVTTAASATVVGLADPPDAVRLPLMLPLALFTPGYSLGAALYPRRDDLELLERLALSFALSLAILPLIALALNYGPWGVRWEPLLACVALVAVLACIGGLMHRRVVPARERFAPSLHLNLKVSAALSAGPRAAVTFALLGPVAALAAALLVLLAAQRGAGEPHTEFYLLPAGGPAASFPRQLMVGQQASLTVGVTNREGEEKLYSVTALVNGTPVQEVTGLRLGPGQRWQRPFAVTLEEAGNRQLLQFDLRLGGAGGRAYRTLYIWLDVLEPLAPPPVDVLAQERAPAPPLQATPTAAPEATPASPQPLVHRVARGENLTLIARLYGVPLQAILAANLLPNPNLIHAQQEILIPAIGGAPGGDQ